jgi:hypothetical protein
MTVLNKLASALNRADEAPNIQLAQEIADRKDKAAVQELVDHLADPDKAIQSDCIKVLYEIGERNPFLIDGHIDAFVKLLSSGSNRLVWGAMTALGWIAASRQWGAKLGRHSDTIMRATEQGSVITQDWGIRVLAVIAADDPASSPRVFAFLKTFLQNCRPKDLPRHAESVAVAVTPANRADILAILEARKLGLKPAQAKRLERLERLIRDQGARLNVRSFSRMARRASSAPCE